MTVRSAAASVERGPFPVKLSHGVRFAALLQQGRELCRLSAVLRTVSSEASSRTTTPFARRASAFSFRSSVPPPAATTRPPARGSSRTACVSRSRNAGSPFFAKISETVMPSRCSIQLVEVEKAPACFFGEQTAARRFSAAHEAAEDDVAEFFSEFKRSFRAEAFEVGVRKAGAEPDFFRRRGLADEHPHAADGFFAAAFRKGEQLRFAGVVDGVEHAGGVFDQFFRRGACSGVREHAGGRRVDEQVPLAAELGNQAVRAPARPALFRAGRRRDVPPLRRCVPAKPR